MENNYELPVKEFDKNKILSLIRSTRKTITIQNSHQIVNGEINSRVIELGTISSLVVIGDIHGDLSSLHQILLKIDYEKWLSNPHNKIIFLGDYVDRGEESLEVVCTLFYLKCKFPSTVILLRGNHEAVSDFPFKSYNFATDIMKKTGKNLGEKIHKEIISIFGMLPILVNVDNMFLLMHGGLPTEISYSDCKQILTHQNPNNKKIIEELVWNDPRIILNDKNWEKSRRLYGKHFGLEITQRWIKESNVRAIIRGHEPCDGFKLDHDNLILTLFSSKKPYPKFESAYLFLKKENFSHIQNAKDLVPFIHILKK